MGNGNQQTGAENLDELATGDTEMKIDEIDRLLATERIFGRVRVPGEHGPRTLDLDLLLYGDEAIDEPGLTVPHPCLHDRSFVLEPLAELNPDLAGLD